MIHPPYKSNFPFFQNNPHVVFLDSAASAQKPKCVIDKLVHIYSTNYSNIHRGLYSTSSALTEEYENARKIIAEYINAPSEKEIIFTRNATESINLVASCVADSLQDSDEIIISVMEHHSNIVPWQQLCHKKGVQLKIVYLLENGELDYQELASLINKRTKLVALTHMSNVTGSIVDISKVKKIIGDKDILLLLDACQSIAHMKIDVKELKCDFLAFSSHKLYGPTGVGVLYAKQDILDKFNPYQTGGAMVDQVSLQETTFQPSPNKFEAGTPAIAEVIAFKEAVKYLKSLDLKRIWQKEEELIELFKLELKKLTNFKLIYSNSNKGIASFTHTKFHHSDIGMLLDKYGIAIRTGHHCAQPLMHFLNISGTARVSVGIYNDIFDIEKTLEALYKIDKLF